MSVVLSASLVSSVCLSAQCSDTTIGKIVSVACILYKALGALGLVLPNDAKEILSQFPCLVSWPSKTCL